MAVDKYTFKYLYEMHAVKFTTKSDTFSLLAQAKNVL